MDQEFNDTYKEIDHDIKIVETYNKDIKIMSSSQQQQSDI